MRPPVDSRLVLSTYWPLAASWLMMGLELPAVSAVMARLPDPEIHLAAYGGIVFPLALLVEAPIIMLLAASTALSRDRVAYRKLVRFTVVAAAVLTAIHVLIAATPLYDWVVGRLLDAPADIRSPARIGLLLMTPWTAAIAFRRLQQGVLIRCGHSRTVGVGTGVRLATNVLCLSFGWWSGRWPGIVVGAGSVACGVVAEAIFIAIRTRPVLQELPEHDPEAVPLTRSRFVRFYTPLALTSMITLLALPIGSAAMGRMPGTLASLAVWPVINGLTFTLRALGLAYNEVVVALLERDGAYKPLFRFAVRLAAGVSGVLLLITATPLSRLWFENLSGLNPELVALGRSTLWLAVLMPAASVMQSWLTGILVNRHRTRVISEAVVLHLSVVGVILGAGIVWGGAPGIQVAVTATFAALLVQIVWLVRGARSSIRELTAPGATASPLEAGSSAR